MVRANVQPAHPRLALSRSSLHGSSGGCDDGDRPLEMLMAAPNVLRVEEDIQALGLDLRIAAVLAVRTRPSPLAADPGSRRRNDSTHRQHTAQLKGTVVAARLTNGRHPLRSLAMARLS